MDSLEEEKAGRSVCCVMQSVRVLVMCCGIVLHMLVNPRRVCAARVTVLALSVCLSVCLSVTALAATAFVSACNQRHLLHSFRLFLD